MLWTELRFLSESNKDPEPLSSLSRPWWSLLVMGYQTLLNLREFSNIFARPPSSSGSTERKAHKQIRKGGSFSERLRPWGGLGVPVCPVALEPVFCFSLVALHHFLHIEKDIILLWHGGSLRAEHANYIIITSKEDQTPFYFISPFKVCP